MRRRWSVLFVVLVVGSLSLAFGSWAASAVAGWLVVEDPLVSARAIVVLNGGFPFRAMEAASLYQQGWAPQVWLTRPSSPAKEEALRQLGMEIDRGESLSREVLERMHVPPEAILML